MYVGLHKELKDKGTWQLWLMSYIRNINYVDPPCQLTWLEKKTIQLNSRISHGVQTLGHGVSSFAFDKTWTPGETCIAVMPLPSGLLVM